MKTIKPTLLLSLALAIVAPPAFAQPGTTTAASTTTAHRRGFGNRGYRSHRGGGIFRSIIRALAIGYLLHLLFTTRLLRY